MTTSLIFFHQAIITFLLQYFIANVNLSEERKELLNSKENDMNSCTTITIN